MSIYTLALDDGSQVEVEAPRDTPLQELLMLAQQQRLDVGKEERLAARRARQTRLEEAAAGPVIIPKDARTALGRGVGRGIDSLQQNLGSAIEGVGGLLGLEGVENYGANVALENEAALQRSERFATRLDDIEGVGTGASYVGELAGESAPQMGAVAAGAAAGAAAGSAFFGVGAIPGALVGAAVGGFAAGFPLFFGSNRERQKDAIDQGLKTEISEGAAALAAIPQAALDSILTVVGAKFFLKPAGEVAGGLLTRARRGATAGVITEVPTEIGQAVLERAQAGLSLTSSEAMREYGEAGLAAGILGGGIGGVGGAVGPRGAPEAAPESGIAGLIGPPEMQGPKFPERQGPPEMQGPPESRPVQGPVGRREGPPEMQGPQFPETQGPPEMQGPQFPEMQGPPKPAPTVETTQAELEQVIGKDSVKPAPTVETTQAEQVIGKDPVKPTGRFGDVALGNSVDGLSITGETPDSSGKGRPTKIEAIEIRGKPVYGRDGTEYTSVFDRNLPYGEPVITVLPPKTSVGVQSSVVVASKVEGDRKKGAKRDNFTAAAVLIKGIDTTDAEIEAASNEALAQWEAAYGGVTKTADVNLKATPTTAAPVAPTTKVDTVQAELEQAIGTDTPAVAQTEAKLEQKIAKITQGKSDADLTKVQREQVNEEIRLAVEGPELVSPKKKTETPTSVEPELLQVFHATKGAPYKKIDTTQADKTAKGGYFTNESAYGPGDYFSVNSSYPSQFVGGKGSLMAAGIDVSNMLDARLGKQKPFTNKQAKQLKNALENRVDVEGNNLQVTQKGNDLIVSYVRNETYGGESRADRIMNRTIPLNKPEEAFIQLKTLANNIKNPLAKDAKGLSDARNSPENTQNLRDILEESGFTGVLGVMDATSGGRDNIVVYDKSVYQNDGNLETIIDQDVIPSDIQGKPITATKGKPDVKTAETKSEPSRDSVPIDKPDVGAESKGTVPSVTAATKSAKGTKPLRDSGVGSPVVEPRPVDGAAARKSTSLEASKAQNKATAERLVAANKAKRTEEEFSASATPGKRTEKTPAQPIPVELKEAKAKRVAAEAEAQPREDLKFADQRSDKATKDRAEKIKTKEADTKQAAIFAAQDTDIQEQGNADSDLEAPQAPMTAADKDKILRLMEAKRTKAKPLVAAIQKYFNQFPTFAAALDAVIYDASMQMPNRSKNDPDYGDNPAKGKFYLANPKAALPSMGKVSARKITDWMTSKDTNMSVELQKYVKKGLQDGSAARVSQANYIAGDRVAKARRDVEADENADREFNLPAELVIDTPLRPSVKAAILKNDLAGALDALRFTTPSKDIALLAKRLMDNIGNTKLITKKNLKTDDGFTKLAGYFDPETNTIALDEKAGINAHALLHEMLHAVTSATIANKSHPLTKKLNKIFEGSKEQLAGEYGITSLDEFVAEAMANPDFQTQLKTTTVNGRNPWQQMTRAIANFVRTLLGRPTVSETSTFDAVDKLVQELIAPTYDGRAATKIYMALGTPNGPQKLLNNQASSNTFDTTTKEGMASYLKQGKALMKSVTVPVAAKNVWINFQPASILGQLAESRIPGATKLNIIINRMSAALREMNDSTDAIVNDIKALRRDGVSKLQRLKGEVSTDFKFLRDIGPIASAYRVDPRVAKFKDAYGHKATYLDPETNKTVPNLNYDPEVAEKVYNEVRGKYLAMSDKGRKLYGVITNAFAKNLVDVDTAITKNLAATINDEAAVKRIRKKLAVYLALERGTITPFMPMIRDGDYRLGYFAVDPRTGQPMYFTEYFKTTKQRKRAIEAIDEYNKEELAKISDTTRRNKIAAQVNIPMEVGIKESKGNYSGAPSDSFVGKVFAVLQAEGANEDTVNGILDLVLDSMPERSLMQSLRIRRDVRGFKGDVTPSGTAGDKRVFGLIDDSFDLIGTVESKGRDYNRQIVQMTYGAELQQFERDILETDELSSKTIDENTKMYKVALGKVANFAKSPDIPKWSQSLNAAGYAWTMGWNFSSAAITPFDVAMSVAPRLMGKYGDAKALKALGTAAAILANSPKTRTVQVMQEDGTMGTRQIKTGGAGFSGNNYNYEEIKAMSKQDIADAKMTPERHATLVDLAPAMKHFRENGQINQSLNQEELDMNNAKDVLEKINSWTSYLFHHAERYNREVTLIATDLLELDRLRTKPRNDKEKALTDLERQELAAETAIVETELTLGSIASAGRPVFAQKGVGNVLMLFKRFAIAKYHMMATMTNDAFPRSGGTPEAKENRRIAQHQLARFLFSTGLFAGIAGLPLMGALGQLYDLFVDDDEDDFDAMLRKIVGEGFYKGLVNEALGADVASRIALNSLLYRPPIIDKDQPGLYTLIEQFAGPLMGIYMSMDRGYDLFKEGEVFKGVQAVLPAAARNVLKSGEQFSTGEVATRRGDVVVEDIGVAQILLQFGGFANAELIQQYDYNKNERRKVSYIGKQRTKLLRKANIAASNRDREAYREVMKEIKEYNRGLPRAAREKNIILPATISRSRKSFVTRTGKMIGGIEYTPLMLESLEQYDQGLQLFD